MKVFLDLHDPEIVTLLKNGAVGVLPSDTVYGLMCVAANEAAVGRLYAIKHRANKPGTLIAANLQQFIKLGMDEQYLKAVERFWPGAVSVRIPHSPANYLVDIPTGTIAARIPDYDELLQVLAKTGALQTTSANVAGAPVVNTIAEAQACFGNTVDFYVDGGDLSGKPASTIVQIIDGKVEVVRQGAVIINK